MPRPAAAARQAGCIARLLACAGAAPSGLPAGASAGARGASGLSAAAAARQAAAAPGGAGIPGRSSSAAPACEQGHWDAGVLEGHNFVLWQQVAGLSAAQARALLADEAPALAAFLAPGTFSAAALARNTHALRALGCLGGAELPPRLRGVLALAPPRAVEQALAARRLAAQPGAPAPAAALAEHLQALMSQAGRRQLSPQRAQAAQVAQLLPLLRARAEQQRQPAPGAAAQGGRDAPWEAVALAVMRGLGLVAQEGAAPRAAPASAGDTGGSPTAAWAGGAAGAQLAPAAAQQQQQQQQRAYTTAAQQQVAASQLGGGGAALAAALRRTARSVAYRRRPEPEPGAAQSLAATLLDHTGMAPGEVLGLLTARPSVLWAGRQPGALRALTDALGPHLGPDAIRGLLRRCPGLLACPEEAAAAALDLLLRRLRLSPEQAAGTGVSARDLAAMAAASPAWLTRPLPELTAQWAFLTGSAKASLQDVVMLPALLSLPVASVLGPRLSYARKRQVKLLLPSHAALLPPLPQQQWQQHRLAPLEFWVTAPERRMCAALGLAHDDFTRFKAAWARPRRARQPASAPSPAQLRCAAEAPAADGEPPDPPAGAPAAAAAMALRLACRAGARPVLRVSPPAARRVRGAFRGVAPPRTSHVQPQAASLASALPPPAQRARQPCPPADVFIEGRLCAELVGLEQLLERMRAAGAAFCSAFTTRGAASAGGVQVQRVALVEGGQLVHGSKDATLDALSRACGGHPGLYLCVLRGAGNATAVYHGTSGNLLDRLSGYLHVAPDGHSVLGFGDKGTADKYNQMQDVLLRNRLALDLWVAPMPGAGEGAAAAEAALLRRFDFAYNSASNGGLRDIDLAGRGQSKLMLPVDVSALEVEAALAVALRGKRLNRLKVLCLRMGMKVPSAAPKREVMALLESRVMEAAGGDARRAPVVAAAELQSWDLWPPGFHEGAYKYELEEYCREHHLDCSGRKKDLRARVAEHRHGLSAFAASGSGESVAAAKGPHAAAAMALRSLARAAALVPAGHVSALWRGAVPARGGAPARWGLHRQYVKPPLLAGGEPAGGQPYIKGRLPAEQLHLEELMKHLQGEPVCSAFAVRGAASGVEVYRVAVLEGAELVHGSKDATMDALREACGGHPGLYVWVLHNAEGKAAASYLGRAGNIYKRNTGYVHAAPNGHSVLGFGDKKTQGKYKTMENALDNKLSLDLCIMARLTALLALLLVAARGSGAADAGAAPASAWLASTRAAGHAQDALSQTVAAFMGGRPTAGGAAGSGSGSGAAAGLLHAPKLIQAALQGALAPSDHADGGLHSVLEGSAALAPAAAQLASSLLVNELATPGARAVERLQQLGQIALDLQGQAEACGAYTFTPGGARVNAKWTGPTFTLTAATGACEVLPSLTGAGNTRWTQAQTVLSCTAPAVSWAWTPLSYAGASRELTELTGPKCAPEVTLGSPVEVTLYGGEPGLKFDSEKDFYAAVTLNKTFDFSTRELRAAAASLQAKLDAGQLKLEELLAAAAPDGDAAVILPAPAQLHERLLAGAGAAKAAAGDAAAQLLAELSKGALAKGVGRSMFAKRAWA
ncbi:hypothetical protein HT031_002955 [Scenedesmus sp. PABB004]|nr:hypothetical protein HT031_002955 [Scenedesmus sp. PABB004]